MNFEEKAKSNSSLFTEWSSYEDFVEGLRPATDPDEESTETRYRYCPGVFKRIAVQALFDCLKPTSADTATVSFEAVWNKLVEEIELDPEKKYPGLTEKTSYRISLTPKGNLEGLNTVSNKTFLCPRSILEKVYAAKAKSKSISSSEVMEIVVRGCHSHFIAAVFNELKRLEKTAAAPQEAPAAAAFSGNKTACAGISQRARGRVCPQARRRLAPLRARDRRNQPWQH